MQNGLEQKTPTGRGDELDSNYVHPTGVNQPYGIAPTTDSYMPSYYGHMAAFPYVGGTEWSTGNDHSMSYLPGYGGEAQQPSFVSDPVFNHPSAALGNTPAYFNQPYNFFPAGNDFSAWASPSAPGHGTAGIPDNTTATGFGQHSAPGTPYSGDYYASIMPATAHDYLGGTGELLPSGNSNMAGAPGAPIPSASGILPSTDSMNKMSVGSSNGMKIVEQGIQNMGLGVSSMPVDPLKQTMALTTAGAVSSGVTPNVVMQGQMGQPVSSAGANSPTLAKSNAPKPVSWAAIASKPAKPQPKSKAKPMPSTGLPPPIKHNMDIGTWDNTQPIPPKGSVRGPMPGQQQVQTQRWSAPRQGVPQGAGGDSQQNGSGLVSQSSGGGGGDAPNDSSKPQSDIDDKVNKVLERLKAENDYNPKRLTLDVRNARFFVIKSYSEDDIHRSIKYNIWCSTEHGNKRLDAAYRAQQGRGPVIFLYSVNGSGHFCGVAEMTSPIDYSKRAGVWSQDKWKGKFQVRWIYAKDVPNNMLRHIRLENNENKPVTNSRDTQEVPAEKGRQVLKIISNYKHTTSIFDDFAHYERREQEEELARQKRNEQMKNRENGRRGDRHSSKHEQQDHGSAQE